MFRLDLTGVEENDSEIRHEDNKNDHNTIFV